MTANDKQNVQKSRPSTDGWNHTQKRKKEKSKCAVKRQRKKERKKKSEMRNEEKNSWKRKKWMRNSTASGASKYKNQKEKQDHEK